MKIFFLFVVVPLVFCQIEMDSYFDLFNGIEITVEYGEFCDNITSFCNSTKGLVCSDEVCECLIPGSMVFEEDLDKCVSLFGGHCDVEPPEDSEFEKTCIENAECRSGMCYCEYGNVVYEDQRCRPPVIDLEYGLHCNTSHFCNFQSILICDAESSSCLCTLEDTMIYDPIYQKCRSVADRNSSCYFSPIGGIQYECIENAYCMADEENPFVGYCECADGFVAYEDRLCRLPTIQHFGQPCNSSHTCDKFSILHCSTTDNTCGCIPNSQMFYEEESSACVSGVGTDSTCFMKPIGDVQRLCTKNAGCLPRPGTPTGLGFCACTDTYVAYEDKTCGLPTFDQSYGERCNASTQCRSDDLLSCNSEFACGCKYEEDLYDLNSGKCTSPANGLCYTEIISGELRTCPSNSECEVIGDPSGKYGYCNCISGYVPDPVLGECIIDLSTSTDTTPSTTEVTTTNELPTSTESNAINFVPEVSLLISVALMHYI